MIQRRWPFVVVAAIVALALLVGAWAIGRATAPDDTTTSDAPAEQGNAVRVLGGVPIGVEHSRGGALAAADNYVATSSETVLQDPARYERFVRTVFTSQAAPAALRQGEALRSDSTAAVENYRDGARGVAIVGARKLEAYDGAEASVLTWGGGFVWGPSQKPSQRWFLVRTRLTWDGQRWRVESLQQLDRPAPAPSAVVVTGDDADTAGAFDRELGGMQAPIYGGG